MPIYFVKKGEQSTIDVAEIGAVANALYHIHLMTGSEDAKKCLINASNYLMAQVAKENSGAVYKNPNAKMHDVLNGDIYAAHTWGRTYELTKNPVYLEKSTDSIKHIMNRFGKHSKGWWPYIENWDGSIGMGNSVSYQGTIIAFAHTCLPIVPQKVRDSWMKIEQEAVETMICAMEHPSNDETEAPWWCREWNNVWEIDLSLWRKKQNSIPKEKVIHRLKQVNKELQSMGIQIFKPKVTNHDPERTPVTTTFRKTATFAGIFSYMVLDDKRWVR